MHKVKNNFLSENFIYETNFPKIFPILKRWGAKSVQLFLSRIERVIKPTYKLFSQQPAPLISELTIIFYLSNLW